MHIIRCRSGSKGRLLCRCIASRCASRLPMSEAAPGVDHESHDNDVEADAPQSGSAQHVGERQARKRPGKSRRDRFHRLVARFAQEAWDDAALDLRAKALPESIARSEESLQKLTMLVRKSVATKLAQDCAESSVISHPDLPPIILSV